MYTYYGTCTHVADGDTVDVELDLGFSIKYKIRVRLYRCNTPEVHGVKHDTEEFARGMSAKRRVEELILGKSVIIESIKDKKGKYGRYLARVYFSKPEVDGTIELNSLLIEEGHATES